jgi:cation transport regulator ChaB
MGRRAVHRVAWSAIEHNYEKKDQGNWVQK